MVSFTQNYGFLIFELKKDMFIIKYKTYQMIADYKYK